MTQIQTVHSLDTVLSSFQRIEPGEPAELCWFLRAEHDARLVMTIYKLVDNRADTEEDRDEANNALRLALQYGAAIQDNVSRALQLCKATDGNLATLRQLQRDTWQCFEELLEYTRVYLRAVDDSTALVDCFNDATEG